jgi:hypothetical protein
MADIAITLDYISMAESFYRAYRELPPQAPPDWPRYLLATHAIELALKGYLLFQGVSEKQLMERSLRHDLAGLLLEATARGLVLSPSTSRNIELLSEPRKAYRPRYPKHVTDTLITIEQCEPCLEELFGAVRPKRRGP